MDGCVLDRTKILKCRLCFIGNDMKEYIWRSCVRIIPCKPHFIRNSSLCMTDKQQSIVFMYYALVMPKYLKSNKQFEEAFKNNQKSYTGSLFPSHSILTNLTVF